MPPTDVERKAARYCYEQCDDMCNAVLLVEGRKMYIVKELLMVGSPVFKAMFTGNFKEAATREVILTNKKAEYVAWMLDYLYPDKLFELTDEMATKLLPLAEEYQLVNLRQQCIDILLDQDEPRLEIVTLAEKFGLEDLLEISIEQCALHVQAEPSGSAKESEFDLQLKFAENVELSKDAVNKILRKKISYAKKRFQDVEHAVDNIVRATSRVCKSDQDTIRKERSKMNFSQRIF